MRTAAFLCLLLAPFASAEAGVITYAFGGTSAGYTLPYYPPESNFPQYYAQNSDSTATASYEAKAGATYGTLKVIAAGMAINGDYAYAHAAAVVSDSFIVNKPGAYGQRGEFTFGVYMDGLLTAGNITPYSLQGTSARLHFDVTATSAHIWDKMTRLQVHNTLSVDDQPEFTSISRSQFISDIYGERSSETQGPYFKLTKEIVFGIPIQIQLALWVDGNVPAYYYPYWSMSYGGFTADASRSGYWDGIKSVTIDGQAVTDFSVISESGTDYLRSHVPTATAMPEPPTYALFALTLAVLLFTRRGDSLSIRAPRRRTACRGHVP